MNDDDLTPSERYRKRAFSRAGFSEVSAEILALSSADLHVVLRALKNGCSLDLALKIFA